MIRGGYAAEISTAAEKKANRARLAQIDLD